MKFILFYSKYSSKCSTIKNTIATYPLYFKYLDTVCIDNHKVRDSILKSTTKIKLTVVPTILIVRDDGVVEQQEGDDAFKWVQDIIQEYSKSDNKLELDSVAKPIPSQSTIETGVEQPVTTQRVQTKQPISELPSIDEAEDPTMIEIDKVAQDNKPKTASQIALEMQKLRDFEDGKLKTR